MTSSVPTTTAVPVDGFLRLVIDAIPSMVFVLDADARILDANLAALALLGAKDSLVFRRLCGDVLLCVHSYAVEGGCGTTESCKTCLVRQGALSATSGAQVHRKLHKMRLELDGREQDYAFLVTASPLAYEEHKLALLVLEDVTELIELREIVPICAHCKKIRNDKELWVRVESYFGRREGLKFSHGVCPECEAAFYSHEK